MFSLFSFLYYTGRIVVIAEDSVRFAHSGPSHCHLRHRCAITCCQRAPPATRVRGWTRLRITTILPLVSWHLVQNRYKTALDTVPRGNGF